MQEECAACKRLMFFKGFWYAHQGHEDFQVNLWQCPQCKDIAVRPSEIPKEDRTARVRSTMKHKPKRKR